MCAPVLFFEIPSMVNEKIRYLRMPNPYIVAITTSVIHPPDYAVLFVKAIGLLPGGTFMP